MDDFDLVELNEAFAAQVLAVLRDEPIPPEQLNVNGGAIALGHPIGCTGARIIVTLLHEMQRRKAARGLATLCVSGGMGMAMAFATALRAMTRGERTAELTVTLSLSLLPCEQLRQLRHRSHPRRRHRQGRHGGSGEGAAGGRREVRPPFELEHAAVERRPLSRDRRDHAAERLRPAAAVRRDLHRRARRSAGARQPARARHPARHAVRAGSLRQLPAGAAARRAALPAEGSRRRATSTSSCSARTPRAVRRHRRPLQGRHRRRGRDPGRDQHLQRRAPDRAARLRVRARRTA